MGPLAALLADTLARWGAAMQRPLYPPAPPPALFSVYAYEAQIEANLRRIEDAKRAAADPALLPSTDYRTNPRPVQVPVAEREPTIDALRAGLLARGPRADALRAAVVRAVFKDT